jgi:hypothetical protein
MQIHTPIQRVHSPFMQTTDVHCTAASLSGSCCAAFRYEMQAVLMARPEHQEHNVQRCTQAASRKRVVASSVHGLIEALCTSNHKWSIYLVQIIQQQLPSSALYSLQSGGNTMHMHAALSGCTCSSSASGLVQPVREVIDALLTCIMRAATIPYSSVVHPPH